jgi:predicted GH43/DUF377 family glycosyl hydrolase
MSWMLGLLVLVVGLTACNHQPQNQKGLGALAPKPLFRDPVFDGAADPSIVYDKHHQRWVMFYTNRRANQEGLDQVTWVHATPIAMAVSKDGANWHYLGQVNFPKTIPYTENTTPKNPATFWAPMVIEHQNTYHMYLTVVPGVFHDWNHPRRIVHLTSLDLQEWTYQSTLPLVNEKVIDAALLQLDEGTWRLWYNNELAGKKTFYADSKDLYQWIDKGSANLPQDRGEAPLVFKWKNRYWLLNDLLGNNGIGVYSSTDATHWQRQNTDLLVGAGTGKDDQNSGHHPDVLINGERAFLYYFVHPNISDDGTTPDPKRTSLQVTELFYENGMLTTYRNEPTYVELNPKQTRR